ncbi:MAG TPA: hypothetical protein VNA29_05540 [Sphingomicrobium sp.]|nr:hypothetical protein [Sphingomicrobium sp.]
MDWLSLLLLAATPEVRPANIIPRASELLEREPVLKEWAMRIFDRNRDGWLTLYEASEAADAFRDIADEDRDGRVSPREYRNALDFIRVRY